MRATTLAVVLAGSALYPAAVRAETYKVDPVHSSVLFRIKHMNVGYFYGRFNDIAGEFTIDPANPSGSSFDFKINLESLDTNNKDRDKHLLGPDFFNAKEFPEIAFKSTQAQKVDEHTYEVVGDLTMHGVTKPVTVRIDYVGSGKEMRGGGTRAGIEAVFTLRRTEFGMKYGLQGLGDEVRVIAALEGTHK